MDELSATPPSSCSPSGYAGLHTLSWTGDGNHEDVIELHQPASAAGLSGGTMDAGTAAITAASISTALGGVLGFMSSYLTTRASLRSARKAAALPRQMDAAQFAGMVLFRALSKETISRATWDQYISSSYWLPSEVRMTCLAVLNNPQEPNLLAAQEAIITLCDKLQKGD